MGKLIEDFEDARDFNPAHLGVRYRRECMVRRAEQDASQSHTVARNREGDHLPTAVLQVFRAASPPFLKNVGDVTAFTLARQLSDRL